MPIFNISDIKQHQLIIEETTTDISIEKKNPSNFRELVIMDILNAIAIAKNIKEFRALIEDMEYKKIVIKTLQVKTAKRENIGFNITTKKKTNLFIPFSQLKLSWSKIVMIFLDNSKKKKSFKKLVSNLDKYDPSKKRISTELIKFDYKVPRLLEFFYAKKVNDIEIDKFDNYHLERSDMYNIISLKNSHNSILITECRITLRKSSAEDYPIQDMMKLAKMKGWDLNHLELSGTKDLVEKTKSYILNQSNKNENIFKLLEEDEITSLVNRKF